MHCYLTKQGAFKFQIGSEQGGGEGTEHRESWCCWNKELVTWKVGNQRIQGNIRDKSKEIKVY